MDDKIISVVIINYNGKRTVLNTIESLIKQEGILTSIKMIDDFSNDGSYELVKEKYPDLLIIRQAKNTKNLNKLRNLALEISETEKVLITDNDIIFDKNCIYELNKAMERDKEIATCTPRLMYLDDPNLIYTAGVKFHYIGAAVCEQRETYLTEYEKTPSKNSGTGIMLINKKIVLDAGGFDDDLIVMAWGDDGELYQRLLSRGLKCLYIPTAFALHEEKPFSKERSYRAEGQLYNRWVIILTHYSLSTLIILSPVLLVYQIIEFFFMLLKKMPHLFFKALKRLFKNIPLILKKRKEFQKLKVVSDIQRLDSGKMYVSRTLIESNKLLKIFLNSLNIILDYYWRVAKVILR